MAIPKFSPDQIEQLACCLANARTHTQLTDLFLRLGFDASSEGSKPRRIRETLLLRQDCDGVGNNVGAFIQEIMSPVNFVNSSDSYASLRASLNKILAFSSLRVSNAGVLERVPAAHTLDEAEVRANELRAKLAARSVHVDVLAFCRPELLNRNYFHAVLEATKSVGAKLRSKSGLADDGAMLIQRALGGQTPYLAINTLCTPTERSEQAGFANLITGLFGTFRNPTAHAPRIQWPVSEQDALDLLTLVSFIHRRLDTAVRTTHHQSATLP